MICDERWGVLAVDADQRVMSVSSCLAELLGRDPGDLVGLNAVELFGEEAHIELIAPDGRAHQLRRKILGEAGGMRIIGLKDVTHELQAERRSRALFDVASRLTVTSVMEGLDELAARLVGPTQANACSVLLIEETPAEPLSQLRLKAFGRSGLPESFGTAIVSIFNQSNFAVSSVEAFRNRRPQVAASADLQEIARSLPPDPELEEYMAAATWKMVFSVPMRFQERTLGTVNCYYDEEPIEPREELLTFLQAVADVVAVSVENARLLKESRGKAVLEERQRIARELHDSVSQALYGISLGTSTSLVHINESRPEQARDSLRYVLSLAEAGLCEMRSLIFELRPDSLESEGLAGALQRQLTTLQARHGVKVEATLLEPPLSIETKHAVYRVVQEALSNVAKHARAECVTLDMVLEDGHLRVHVADDGLGFVTGQRHPGHYGLKTMSERVAQQRGRLQLDSRPGGGTKLMLEIPLSGVTAVPLPSA